MSLSISIVIVGLLAALSGIKKPWLGGIIGLISFLFLFYQYISDVILLFIIIVPMGFLFGLTAGFISYMIFSGSDDKETNTT
jgi:hypothetical protein